MNTKRRPNWETLIYSALKSYSSSFQFDWKIKLKISERTATTIIVNKINLLVDHTGKTCGSNQVKLSIHERIYVVKKLFAHVQR